MHQIIPASPWVERFAARLPKTGQILDLACGSGRHTRLLAGLGHRVLAVDRDLDALAGLRDLPGVDTRALDLEGETWPLAGEQFSGIVVTNYLWRPYLPTLLGQLEVGGVLIYETFMVGNEAYGKPANPKFLVLPGELREIVKAAGLAELAFEEGYTATPWPAIRQAIVARRPT